MYKRTTTDDDLIRKCANGNMVRVRVGKVAAELLQRKQRDKTRLTARELDCLVYRMLGYSSIEIHKIMRGDDGSAFKTMDYASTFYHVRSKLGVANDFEMAYMAYERGWVDLHEATDRVIPGDYQCTSVTCDWTGPARLMCPVCLSDTEPETGECAGGAPMGVSDSPNYR